MLKFHSLVKLEEYIKNTYYGETQQSSMYFQIQFVKFFCQQDDAKAITSELKRLRTAQNREYEINQATEKICCFA